jgi:hypothetical protein
VIKSRSLILAFRADGRQLAFLRPSLPGAETAVHLPNVAGYARGYRRPCLIAAMSIGRADVAIGPLWRTKVAKGVRDIIRREWWSELMMGLGSGCEDGAGQKMTGGRHATSAPSGLARGSN